MFSKSSLMPFIILYSLYYHRERRLLSFTFRRHQSLGGEEYFMPSLGMPFHQILLCYHMGGMSRRLYSADCHRARKGVGRRQAFKGLGSCMFFFELVQIV